MKANRKTLRGYTVQVSLSLPEDLLESLDKIAEKLNRPRSNLIAYVLTHALKLNEDIENPAP